MRERESKNTALKNGDIEILVDDLRLLSKAQTLAAVVGPLEALHGIHFPFSFPADAKPPYFMAGSASLICDLYIASTGEAAQQKALELCTALRQEA